MATTLSFRTLAAVQAHQFVGSYHFDADAFKAIDVFAADASNSIEDRASALWHAGRAGMGLTPEQNQEHLSPQQVVDEFMTNLPV